MNAHVKNFLRRILKRVDRNGNLYRLRGPIVRRFRFIGVDVLSADEGNSLVGALVRSGRPASIGKIGNSELRGLLAIELAARSGGPVAPAMLRELMTGPGVFPADTATAQAWSKAWLEAVAAVDLFGVWYIKGEDRLIGRAAPRARLARYRFLDPYHFAAPWSAELAGRRVVVVSPFAASIERQYRSRRREIWAGRDEVLPAFDLRVVRSPLSPALVPPEEASYFERVARLEAELLAEPFDVALIGAGAMSLPLCAAAKRAGAIGIHLGGATQILFGIRGARWDTNPDIARHFNAHWTRPLPSETPAKAGLVENACYW